VGFANPRYSFPALGPGGRWRIWSDLPKDDILVSIDDDIYIGNAPSLIEKLVAAARTGCGAAASGTSPNGAWVRWGMHHMPGIYDGSLICMIASAMAIRVGDLEGLHEMRDAVLQRSRVDVLGLGGDDEALVSACLWKRGVPMKHVPVDGLALAAGTQEHCQTLERLKAGAWDRQRVMIREATGWPWPST
jgi:hypothetical protein